METFLNKLEAGLARVSAAPHRGRYAVAFSGGVDSTVLLAGLVRLGLAGRVRALHVDHGLHPDSARWQRHCEQAAAALGVRYRGRRVSIERRPGQSLEALAREARYRALAEMVEPGEVLLTAHHRDDQLETVLLRLLRGAGVRGLRGIRERTAFNGMPIGRPMLAVGRDEIRASAGAWGLQWLEDPANDDVRFDRNHLRTAVLPALERRWPAVGRRLAETARRMADAEEILQATAKSDAAGFERPDRVPCAQLLALSAARQRNLLRHVIGRAGLPLPDGRQLEILRDALSITRPDAGTQVQWPGAEARIYKGHLYLHRPPAAGSGSGRVARLAPGLDWHGPEGRLTLAPTTAPGVPDAWARAGLEVRFRVGGERFCPLGAVRRRALKRWLHEAGIVPWMRGRIPLLYHDAELVAVGDLWLSRALEDVRDDGARWRVVWTGHPPLR